VVWARRSLGSVWPPLIALGVIVLGWELYARLVLGAIAGGERILPAPTRILGALANNVAVIGPHAWQTLVETVLGFGLALLVGVGMALLIDSSALLRRAVYPVLVVSQTIPLIAFAPLLVLWFGYGVAPKVLIVALVCFFPIVVATADGLRATDPELVRLFRTFGADRLGILRKVRLPGSLPSFFSGVRIAVTYSVTGAIWGEYVGAENGLGIYMLRLQNSAQTAQVFAAILVISALSMFLYFVTAVIERLTIPWYFASRRGSETQGIL
jgi:ABC-type nitrate/sulfonate/bicarbonate transport system permease component